jgi:hypothetical protein
MAAIIGTEATRNGISERLLAKGCDLAKAIDRGTYVTFDAAEALSQAIVGGRLDADRVAAFVNDLERSRLAVSASNLTVVGEMSALLCADGHHEAALQMEPTWDDLTRGLPFLTVCCYSTAPFNEERPELFPRSARHTRPPATHTPHSAACRKPSFFTARPSSADARGSAPCTSICDAARSISRRSSALS